MKLSRFILPILLLGCLAIPALAQTVIAPAGSTAAIPQPNGTTVFVYPLIHDLEPYIAAALGVLITSLVALLTAFLKQHFNVVLTANQQAQLTSMVKTEAGSWIAKGDASVMNAQVNVGSPDIAAAANKIIAGAPDIAKALGVTPAIVQQKIVGEIGHLQAGSSATVSPPSK